MESMNGLMDGKICLITGATSGIGEVAAHELAAQGAIIVVNGRNEEKCIATVDSIKRKTGNTKVNYILADLSSQNEVRQLASMFKSQFNQLNILINNAGVVIGNRQESVDGVEMTFAVNHISHFLLTNLLLDTIKGSTPARIINVSSAVHSWSSINFEDLNGRKEYTAMNAYAQSKLANILFTYELANRLKGSGVSVNALHPGLVATNLGANINGSEGKSWHSFIQQGITPKEGAQTILYLVTSSEVEHVTGKYFENMRTISSSKESYDKSIAKKLWQVSTELTELEPS